MGHQFLIGFNQRSTMNMFASVLLFASIACAAPQFGGFGINQGITSEQRATYLPVMRALLKVVSTNRPSSRDINDLLIKTRELNKKVPKGENLLGSFGFENTWLEDMGLPKSGDLVKDVKGVPHIKTTFGVFPLSDTSLMTEQERQQFLPVVRTFDSILEKGSADGADTNALLQEIQELNKLIPANIGSSIQGLFGNLGSFGNFSG